MVGSLGVLEALDGLVPGVWAVVFKESMSPKPQLVFPTREVLEQSRGHLGDKGS